MLHSILFKHAKCILLECSEHMKLNHYNIFKKNSSHNYTTYDSTLIPPYICKIPMIHTAHYILQMLLWYMELHNDVELLPQRH